MFIQNGSFVRKISFLSVALSIGILLLCGATVSAQDQETPEPDEEGFVAIFNGEDMTGWEGKEGWWNVEDGALTARSTTERPCVKHNYLMWRGGTAEGDFELKFSYKIDGGNSGVQFRSRELDNWDIEGYQADIEAGTTWTGCLFEVKVRNGGVAMRGTRTTTNPDGTQEIEEIGDPEELMGKVKQGEWNDYHIIARGDHVTLIINGVVMCEAIDRAERRVEPGGMIAFQMHPGPPMVVQFKNVRLKMLNEEEDEE